MGQDTRTTATRIADALAFLPAKDSATARMAYAEFFALNDEGLARVLENIRPNGDPSGVPFRYALELLAQQARTEDDRSRIERALLSALAKSTHEEVSRYFVSYLSRLGSNRAVPVLAGLLSDPPLGDPAIGALQAIGTAEAMDVLRSHLTGGPSSIQIRIIQALAQRRDKAAVGSLTQLTASPIKEISNESAWALARIADSSSEPVLLEMAARAGYAGVEIDALIQFMNTRSTEGGNAEAIRKYILDNATAPSQQHYRLAALKNLVMVSPGSSQGVLAAELDRFDDLYRRDVLAIARSASGDVKVRDAWLRLYKKTTGEKQGEILSMLAESYQDEGFVDQQILPALDSKNQAVRTTALQALAGTRKSRFAEPMAAFLLRPTITQADRDAATASFLQLAGPVQVRSLVKQLRPGKVETTVTVINIIAERRDTADASFVFAQTYSPDPAVRAAAYSALPNVSSPGVIQQLLGMLKTAKTPQEIAPLQQALIAVAGPETSPTILQATAEQKVRLLPVLPYLGDKQSLKTVKTSFDQAQGEEKQLAFAALTNWQNGDATPMLLSIVREGSKLYHPRAYSAYVRQVMNTDWPADQKLLKLREIFPLATHPDEQRLVLKEAANIRTFLSFAFVSSFLNDAELGPTASRSTMRLALPTAGAQPGMEGMEVRSALQKVMDKLTGPDSQYDRIDVQTYLDNMPYTPGFQPLFNGKDLTGWQGLVENPLTRAKMPKEELERKQAAADAKLSESWSVKDGMICFTGSGDNLCTTRPYGDVELLVDWKISKEGDSGIYLRGSPQVQIWDTSRVDVGAQVGSGGLYNNTVNRNPLVVADNPIGEWNTLYIRMVGERVTVYLNGALVVDNVVMENYWDRKIPIFPEGPIELQAHGTELAFRNIYVRELNKPYQLTIDEREQGFEILFNGNDLSGWVGNKTDYVVDDHVIAIYPTGRGKGNLYTEKEYSSFIFRFEFMLTPAGNNGLGIHAPLEGDAAYVGKEIQILDDGHPSYADIQPYQVHGSVYGVIPAKRGFLRPVGEWNVEEVEVRGDKIKVTVNGAIVVDGDMKKASEKGTIDKQQHPGLQRHTGHIGFLGHGSVVKFRNIRIKTLP